MCFKRYNSSVVLIIINITIIIILLILVVNIPPSSSTSSTNQSSYSYTSYQGGVKCSPSQASTTPKDLSELQALVASAASTNSTVRALGHLYSASDSICTSGTPVNMSMFNNFSYDPNTALATVGAGMELGSFLNLLHSHGRALEGNPSFGGITIGGALATGSFGSSLVHKATLSDQIVSIKVVNGSGGVETFSKKEEEEDPDITFDAFRVNLGLLGIIFEVTLSTTPQYKLSVERSDEDDGILFQPNFLEGVVRSSDYFQFYWFPTSKRAVIMKGTRADSNATGLCRLNHIRAFDRLAARSLSNSMDAMQENRDEVGFFLLQTWTRYGLTKNVPGMGGYYVSGKKNGTGGGSDSSCEGKKATGWSHRMSVDNCTAGRCYWDLGKDSLLTEEFSFWVPINESMGALQTVRDLINEHPAEFPLRGIWGRFVPKGEGSLLGMNGDGEGMSLEWVTVPRRDRSQARMGIQVYQAVAQALIKKHKGRPHWGKNGHYYHSVEVIQPAFPRIIPDFLRVMERMDPQGVFMNELGRRLKNISNEAVVLPKKRKWCGLNDACLCGSDTDCGKEGPRDSSCGTLKDFPDYPVCKPQEGNLLDDAKVTAEAKTIETLVTSKITQDVTVQMLSKYKDLEDLFGGKGNLLQLPGAVNSVINLANTKRAGKSLL